MDARGAHQLRRRLRRALLGRGRAGRRCDRQAAAAARRRDHEPRRPDRAGPRPRHRAGSSASTPRSTSTSSSPRASMPSWRCRASWRRAPTRRSSSCSSARSTRASTTPACAAAFLKCAVESHGLTGDIPRILRTVAAAAVQTGVPVMVHTNAAHRPACGAAGADRGGRGAVADRHRPRRRQQRPGLPARPGRLRGVAGLGPLRDRALQPDWLIGSARCSRLVAEGYAERIHLSHDAACFYDFMVGNPFFADEQPDYLLISHEVHPGAAGGGGHRRRRSIR